MFAGSLMGSAHPSPDGGDASGASSFTEHDGDGSSSPAAILPTNNQGVLAPRFHSRTISQLCLAGELSRKTCKFHWRDALLEEFFHLSTEQAWNVATNSHIRDNMRQGHFFDYWIDAVERFRFSRWKDDNDFLDDYIGHGMMGAISADIYIQNDPRSMTLVFDNSKAYWKSRLRALAWAAAYSLQWKLGPLSEASIGYQGISYYYDKDGRLWTNGTGFETLVTTPVVGVIWSVGEDNIDKHLITRLERKSENRAWLFTISFLTPCRSFANLMRFKAPWYRDMRVVRHAIR
jgi:hypothetical protein